MYMYTILFNNLTLFIFGKRNNFQYTVTISGVKNAFKEYHVFNMLSVINRCFYNALVTVIYVCTLITVVCLVIGSVFLSGCTSESGDCMGNGRLIE